MASPTANTNGEDNVSHDFIDKSVSDCLSNKVMAEITRRLQSNIEFNDGLQVVFAPEPPNSKERLWVKKDTTGGIIGTIKRYDSPTSDWVDDHFKADEEDVSNLPSGSVIQRKIQKYDPPEIQILSTAFTNVDGSEIAFKPVTVNSFVEYKFRFQFAGDSVATNGTVIHVELLRDTGIEEFSQHSFMSGGTGVYGDSVANYGHILNSWGPTEQTVVLSARHFTFGNSAQLHANNYWNGATNQDVLAQAQLIITEYKK